jgi:hypothetical protein
MIQRRNKPPRGRKKSQFPRKVRAKSLVQSIVNRPSASEEILQELAEEEMVVPRIEENDPNDDRISISLPSVTKRWRYPGELRKSLLREFPNVGVTGMIHIDAFTESFFLKQSLLDSIKNQGASGKRITLLTSLNGSLRSSLNALQQLSKQAGNSGAYQPVEERSVEELKAKHKEIGFIVGKEEQARLDKEHIKKTIRRKDGQPMTEEDVNRIYSNIKREFGLDSSHGIQRQVFLQESVTDKKDSETALNAPGSTILPQDESEVGEE